MNPPSPPIPQNLAAKCPRALVGRAYAAMCIGFALAWPAHAADPCDILYNAGIKSLQTPHHVYSTKTLAHGVKSQTSEAIFAGGTEYIRIDGKWQRSRMTPQDMIDAAQEKLKTHHGDQQVSHLPANIIRRGSVQLWGKGDIVARHRTVFVGARHGRSHRPDNRYPVLRARRAAAYSGSHRNVSLLAAAAPVSL